MKKILHISHDDKFIDYTIEKFYEISNFNHTFLIYTETEVLKLTHVKSKKVIFAKKNSEEIKKHIKNIENFNLIFVHYLSDYVAQIIQRVCHKKKIFMIFYGSEIFNMKEFYESTLQSETKKLIKKINKKNFKFIELKKEINRYIYSRKVEKIKKEVLSNVDYFCHWISQDYSLIKSKIKIDAKFLDFIHGSLDMIISPESLRNSKNNDSEHILVGNSANESNNHLDILEKLYQCDNDGKKIYMPLSYSESSSEYTKEVIKKGETLFANKYISIKKFLQKNEYYNLCLKCEFIFMNHYRSQAGAVNRFVLYFGKKLFMSEKSNMYKFYKQIGLIVFSIEKELVRNNPDIWKKLTKKQKEHNKLILEKKFGANEINLKYNKIFNVIENLDC